MGGHPVFCLVFLATAHVIGFAGPATCIDVDDGSGSGSGSGPGMGTCLATKLPVSGSHATASATDSSGFGSAAVHRYYI